MSKTNGWKPYKLEELGFLGRGRSRHRPRNEPSLYGGEYPFFQTGDIKAADLYLHEYQQTYNEKGLAQSKLWNPGTLCITIAANIAETAILGIKGCFPDSVVGFIAYPQKSDPRFIKYYIDTIKINMQNVSKGTTQDNLSLDKLQRFDFVAPNVATQRKIASILSAYDDLIENNTRRIAILEEMAQAIYREWFVNFRFPGHKNVKLVDSSLGQIPEGWEVKPLSKVAQITMGTSPKSSTYNDVGDGTPLVNGPVEFGDRFTKRVKWTTDPKRFCDAGDLVVCVRGSTTGKYVKSDGSYCLGRGVCGIRGKQQSFVDHLFTDQLPSLLAQTGGSTFPSWTGPQLKSHQVLSPSQRLIELFDHHVAPIQEAIYVHSRKTESLRVTRDLLLPKLISGKLDVEELDIDTGELTEELEETTA